MSLNVSVQIKDCQIDEQQFKEKMNRYFGQLPKNITKTERSVTYDDYFQDYGFVITFVEKKRDLYNIYDSNILKDGFLYKQEIIFGLDKTKIFKEMIFDIIDFCCNIFYKSKNEILVASDSHDEICFISFLEETVFLSSQIMIDEKIFRKNNLSINYFD